MRLPWIRRPTVIVARDPDSGFTALYVDGDLVHDFGIDDAFDSSPLHPNHWSDALEALFDRLDVDYDVESHHQLSQKVNNYLDPVEYDSYWPQRLADAPLEDVSRYEVLP